MGMVARDEITPSPSSLPRIPWPIHTPPEIDIPTLILGNRGSALTEQAQRAAKGFTSIGVRRRGDVPEGDVCAPYLPN
jgi:hypothetical protein